MSQNIILSIEDYRDRLPKSEQKIANYILANVNEVTTLSVQELAKKADSSPAAIIRFCRSIQVNGFTELKLLLSANLGATGSKVYYEVENGESTKVIKQKLTLRLNHALERTSACLDERVVDQLVQEIEKVDMVFVYGLGASSLVAQDIHQKFTRLGKYIFYAADHHLFAAALSSAKVSALFIAISNTGETQEVIRLAEIAQAKPMKIAALTANAQSTLAKQSEMILLTVKGEEAPLRSAATVSLISQFYVTDVLFFAYAAQNYQGTLAQIRDSKKAVEHLKKGEE